MGYAISKRTLARIETAARNLVAAGLRVTVRNVAESTGLVERTAAEGLRRLGLARAPGRPVADGTGRGADRLRREKLAREAAERSMAARISRGTQLGVRQAVRYCQTAYRSTPTAYVWDDGRAGSRRPADLPRRLEVALHHSGRCGPDEERSPPGIWL